MNLDDIQDFLVFSQHLNFTRAAEELQISQPALHVKVKKLASDLGVPLYVKVGRGLELTQQGERLALYGQELKVGKEQLLTDLTGQDFTAPVTLAAGAGSYLYLLGDAIRNFRSHSKGDLNLVTANRSDALSHLKSGRADLVVTVLNSVPQGAQAHKLCSIPVQLVVPKEHPLVQHPRLALSQLEDLALIVPPSGSPFRETLETYLKEAQVSWRVALVASGWELMMHFVALGLGLTLVNGCCRVPENCRAIPVPALPSADYHLLWRKGAKLGPNALKLKDSIIQTKFTDL